MQRFDFPPLPDHSRLELQHHPLGTEIVLPWQRSFYDWAIDGIGVVLTIALYLGFRQILVNAIGRNILIFDLLLVVVLVFNAGRILFFIMATRKGKRILRFGKKQLQHIVYLPVMGERSVSKLDYQNIRQLKLSDRQGMQVLAGSGGPDVALQFGAGLAMADLQWLKSTVDALIQEHR